MNPGSTDTLATARLAREIDLVRLHVNHPTRFAPQLAEDARKGLVVLDALARLHPAGPDHRCARCRVERPGPDGHTYPCATLRAALLALVPPTSGRR